MSDENHVDTNELVLLISFYYKVLSLNNDTYISIFLTYNLVNSEINNLFFSFLPYSMNYIFEMYINLFPFYSNSCCNSCASNLKVYYQLIINISLESTSLHLCKSTTKNAMIISLYTQHYSGDCVTGSNLWGHRLIWKSLLWTGQTKMMTVLCVSSMCLVIKYTWGCL